MPETKYRQIAEKMREKIEAGHFPPGSKLPSEIELQDEYNAARNTVRSAVELLISRGLVETRQGQGTFIVEKFQPFITTLSGDWQTEEGLGGGEGAAAFKEVKARKRKARASMPRVEIQLADKKVIDPLADKKVAEPLGVPENSNVISRHQERYIDEQPWSLQTSYYPMSLVFDGAQRLVEAGDIPEGTVKYLETAIGRKQVGYQDEMLVRVPDKHEAEFFRLPEDGRIPVVVLLRTAFAESPDGPKPFRLTESVFPSDRNRFVINAGEVPDPLAEITEA